MSIATVTRQKTIEDVLAREGFVSVAALCALFDCSEATIRRDLTQLERAGKLRRAHGGAVVETAGELPYKMKALTMGAAKRRIARAAAAMVDNGQVVGFTGGTTTQYVARELVAGHGLTVVTNALTVAMVFADSDARIIVTGGELRGKTFELVGPLSEPVVTQVNLDIMFVGVDGVSVDGGLTTHSPLEARINRVLLDRADRAVVVSDHTKLGRKTFAQIAPLEVVDTLLTDDEGDPVAIAEVRRLGLRVETV